MSAPTNEGKREYRFEDEEETVTPELEYSKYESMFDYLDRHGLDTPSIGENPLHHQQ